MDPTVDNQIVRMREFALHQTHCQCFFHVVVPYMIIIHVQSHSHCNQDVTEYGNVIQACGGTVHKHSPVASSRRCGGH